jgi:putative ABC transport system substrate-binding protein
MTRREFIAGLGSTAVWPVVARAQQAAMPVVGFLDFGTSETTNLTALREGLGEGGLIKSGFAAARGERPI